MNLSKRLKEAEQERRRSAGLPPEPPDAASDPVAPVVDLRRTTSSDDVIDLSDVQPRVAPRPRRVPTPAVTYEPLPEVGATGIAYDPVRNGDASSAFGDPSPTDFDRRSARTCPKCGGETQIDLIDQVHQTVSLSCLSCFHMFRVEQ